MSNAPFNLQSLDIDESSSASVIDAADINGGGNRLSQGESYMVFASDPELLIGTEGDDFLTSTDEDDLISGGAGRDIIDSFAGADDILGGEGNDLITAGEDNDIVRGQQDNDLIFGNEGDDILHGNRGSDRIFGDDGDDRILGGKDNDLLFGGNGNDLIFGGDGDDTLIGVDLSSPNSLFGKGEQDTLVGDKRASFNPINGSDTFILGDENNVFYDDGDASTSGESDFALIRRFDATEDIIQLQGSADLYRLEFSSVGSTTDAQLIFAPETDAVGELIAVLKDVDTDLNLEDSAFTFV
ncbi:MAG: calcium-binding protein [Xenococcaceae cyanobacterium MO_167.B27]|nr:calcium-binding protein [Xenococcaceae cyanobacterium MO_167.B27]